MFCENTLKHKDTRTHAQSDCNDMYLYTYVCAFLMFNEIRLCNMENI